MKKYVYLAIYFLFGYSPLIAQNGDCYQTYGSAEFLKGVWVGEFHQYSCGINERYPMTIEINQVKGKRVYGYFIWESLPTSEASSSQLVGELQGDSVILHETSLVSGGGIVLDGYYFSKLLNCYTLEGKWRLKKAQPEFCENLAPFEDAGSYSIRRVSGPLAKKASPAPLKKTPPPNNTPTRPEQKPFSSQEKTEPKPKPTPKIVDPPTETKREVYVKEDLRIRGKYITLALWDNGRQDGDIISLRINGETVLEKYTVKHKAKKLILPLPEHENIIELYAHNLGEIPPNTAAVSVSIGGKIIKQLVLKSDMNRSEAIRIYRE